MEIKMIVVTGGPCAGKTTAMPRIQRDIGALGYRVLTIPETATEFITGGVAPWTCGTNFDYQTVQMHLQREKERCFLRAAATMEAQTDKILIVCDRAMYDNMVYIDKEGFYQILQNMETDEDTVLGTYDAVFHLVTSAIGTDSFSKENNAIRYENAEESVRMDAKFEQAWAPHPEHYKVLSGMDFEQKLQTLINGISVLLTGTPVYPNAPLPEKLPQFKDDAPWAHEAVFPDA